MTPCRPRPSGAHWRSDPSATLSVALLALSWSFNASERRLQLAARWLCGRWLRLGVVQPLMAGVHLPGVPADKPK